MEYKNEILKVINHIRDDLSTVDFSQIQINQEQNKKKYAYTIYKEREKDRLAKEKKPPLIHINTLAQILYESFHDLDKKNSLIRPVIVISDISTVTGVKDSGTYFINLEHDELVKISDYADIPTIKDKVSPRLAIGYMLVLEELKNLGKDTFTSQLVKDLQFMVQSIQHMLAIHGELIDVIKIPVIENLSEYDGDITPVFLYQVLVNRNAKE
ncbi:hypothetical protein ACQKMZ_28130 [Bacillus paramycoides]|uniref:hypothetical protein n=1 Tax=Bacillus paramycoides TaxID=2026194 RepID=UPI003D02080B